MRDDDAFFKISGCPCARGYGTGPDQLAAQAQTTLRVTAIPDESPPTELARATAPLAGTWKRIPARGVHPGVGLRRRGWKVWPTSRSIYPGTGLHLVQANIRRAARQCPGAARRGRRVSPAFITSNPAIQNLADLKGKSVILARCPATSGHSCRAAICCKRRFERDFKRVAFGRARRHHRRRGVGGQGRCRGRSTSRCGKVRGRGKVDSTKLRVFYTTPSYFDYNWTVHADMPAAQREKWPRPPQARRQHARRASGNPVPSAPRASSHPKPRTTRASSRRRAARVC